ncbi:MAG: enoyl-CoA hydratase, partial [Acidimicrobiaceae bacterium]
NAITHDALEELHGALTKAEGEAGSVLLVGRPGKFSAGFDLSVMTAGDEPMRTLVTAGAGLLMRLFTYPLPVVAACTGHALAAGALVLLASDQRIGVEGAFKIGLNEVAIGMPLPHFAIELARYRMPPSRFDSVLLGEVFAPADAVAAGYLDRVVAPDDLLADAKATADRLAELRRGAVSRSKLVAREAIADAIGARLEADMAQVTTPQP